MTTSSWSTSFTNTSSATFRVWGSGISAALTAIGMTKTADTGQINWTTVTVPTGANTTKGYEIWRFNDTAQTTYPLFFRLDYGAGSATANPAISLTIGKSSSGAGVIGSVIMAATVIGGAASSNTSLASYASSSTTGFTLYPGLAGPVTLGFTIERSLDSTGAGAGDGVAVVLSGSGGMSWLQYAYADPTTNVYGYSPIFMPNSVGNGGFSSSTSLSADGSVAPIFPLPMTCTGVSPWISKQLMAVAPGDAGTFTASPHGTAHTYRAFNLYGIDVCPIAAGSSTAYMFPAAIYWE